ncbi:MAG: class I SAM-dependent methyltransferase [Promethearchaeota archaeon]
MKHQSKLWMEAYQEIVTKWKLEPDWKLMQYCQLLAKGPVMDLGMGNGRNSLFFAKMGFEVDCIDVSKTFVKRCQERAHEENLTMTAQVADIRYYEIPKHRYALIIASRVLQFFKKSEIETIADKINRGLIRRGIVYVRAFSLEELKNVRDTKNLELVEPNTYYHRKYRLYNHFFTKDEVVSLFPKLKVLICVEGMELLLQYKKPRYQWTIEYIGQRIR